MTQVDTVRPFAQEVPLGVPLSLQYGETRAVPMVTALFRTASRLPTALREVYARTQEGEQITVVSAGCSTGAELDSVMALHNASGRANQLVAVGLDVGHTAISAAQQAAHYVRSTVGMESVLRRRMRTLDEYGFVQVGASQKAYGRHSHGGYQQISSGQVRAGHNVAFEVDDLTVNKPRLQGGAHLVLAKNILYHLEPHEADSVATSLAEMVGERGVLSIDTPNDWLLQRDIGRHQQRSGLKYGVWLTQTANRWAETYGLVPIQRDITGVPVAFARA